jgi:hypothetical protein
MKKILFLQLVLAFLNANAQSYQYISFPTGNAIWSEYYVSEEQPSPPWFYYYYDKIAMTGEDTTISGKIYKKLYLFNDSVFNINNATYLGGIREENKKIYYLGDTIRSVPPIWGSLQETLLYDFNLNIGDTLHQITYCNFFGDFPVANIDTILIGNIPRRRIEFAGSYSRWVEGIGNLEGLLFPIVHSVTKAGQPSGSIICFKVNDTIVYFNNQFPECMPLNVPAKSAVLSNIVISPNPATNSLTLNIENVQLSPFTFQLYDMQGRLQLTGKTGNTQTELNVATLPRGLYVLKIITEKEIITKKIVLQ